MARGANAKIQVENRIRLEFGDDFVGSDGKALYVWADDGNEKVQIKIALTCPKTNFEGTDVAPAAPAKSGGFNWDTGSTAETAPAELTEEEKQTVNDLLSKLGL